MEDYKSAKNLKYACKNWMSFTWPQSKDMLIETIKHGSSFILIDREGKTIPIEVILKGTTHERQEIAKKIAWLTMVGKRSGKGGYVITSLKDFKNVVNFAFKGEEINKGHLLDVRAYMVDLLNESKSDESKTFKA